MDANEAPPNPAPATLSEQVRKVLAEAAKPLTVKQVKAGVDKLFPKGTKPAAKPSAAGVQGELERGGAFKHPVEKKSGEPTYWHKAYVPPPSPAELVAKAVREKVAGLTDDQLVTDKQLGKPTPAKATPETVKAYDDTLAELLNSGDLHRHGKNYGKQKPPSVAEQVAANVRAKVAELNADDVVAEAKLGKPAGKAVSTEAKQAFTDTLAELLKSGQLHCHGKNYGRRPPKWYEAETAKKPFNDLVKNAKKLIEELRAATADEVLAALREKLGSPATPVAPKPQPPVSHAPASPPPVAPAADLRTVLKQSYDHLCEFVEFQHELVPLPRLYREAVKRMPGLTPDVFQSELWRMNDERVIQLHVLNEVREAKDPELAIFRNDRLYYFARWN